MTRGARRGAQLNCLFDPKHVSSFMRESRVINEGIALRWFVSRAQRRVFVTVALLDAFRRSIKVRGRSFSCRLRLNSRDVYLNLPDSTTWHES
jgi:hypothetical protein